jgi:uncharacterized alpha/beta hydrolase family protein
MNRQKSLQTIKRKLIIIIIIIAKIIIIITNVENKNKKKKKNNNNDDSKRDLYLHEHTTTMYVCGCLVNESKAHETVGHTTTPEPTSDVNVT